MNKQDEILVPFENQIASVSEEVKLPSSMRKLSKEGINIEFVDGDNIIKFHGASFSGMETVYLNDEIVSKSRHITFSSRHFFTTDEHNYELDVLTRKIRTGVIECSLMKDGTLIGRKSTLLEEAGHLTWKNLGINFAKGLAFGVAIAFLIDLIW